jgi:hypothetical protein
MIGHVLNEKFCCLEAVSHPTVDPPCPDCLDRVEPPSFLEQFPNLQAEATDEPWITRAMMWRDWHSIPFL